MSKKEAIIKAKEVLKLVWDGNIPVRPAQIAQDLFVEQKSSDGTKHRCKIIVAPGDKEDFLNISSSVSFISSKDPVFMIEYSPNEIIYRQNFTIAHSLGHIILGHVNENNSKSHSDFIIDNDDSEKYDASFFALELLMPEMIVRDVFPSVKSIQQFAEFFKVSVPAVTTRLKHLGII